MIRTSSLTSTIRTTLGPVTARDETLARLAAEALQPGIGGSLSLTLPTDAHFGAPADPTVWADAAQTLA